MSSPTPPNKEPKELSNEVRMVLAFVLMGLILVVTPWAYRQLGITPPPSADKKQTSAAKKRDNAGAATSGSTTAGATTAASTTASGTPMTLSTPPPAENAPSEPVEGAVSAASAQDYTLDTDLYHIVLTNRGATVKSWTLKKFKDSAGKPLELVNQKGTEKVGYAFSFTFRDKQPTSDLNKGLWVAHPSQETISFEYSDGRTHATKTFALQPNGYMVEYSDEVTQGGTGIPHLVQWRGGFGDMAVQSAAGQQATIYYDLDKNKLIQEGAPSPPRTGLSTPMECFPSRESTINTSPRPFFRPRIPSFRQRRFRTQSRRRSTPPKILIQG